MKYKSIVDHILKCTCGSMNSPYLRECGFCGTDNKNYSTFLETNSEKEV